MTQIFISYSTQDRRLCDAVRKELRRRGIDAAFVDCDPADGIRPGHLWEKEIYLALRRCEVVLALDTPNWRKSNWCFAEMVLARSLGKKTILVRDPSVGRRLEGAAELTRDSQAFVLGESIRRAEPLFDELKRLGIGALRRFEPTPGRAPYPGLVPLESQDAGVFFGRGGETQAVVDLVERLVRYGEKILLLCEGPSGCGKSSLIRAGVLPQMRLRPNWNVSTPLVPRFDTQWPSVTGRRADTRHSLYVIDQMDEAMADPKAIQKMLAWLRQLDAKRRGRALVLGTLRTDSLSLFHEQLGILAPATEHFVLGPLTREGFKEIITRPAEALEAAVAPRLVDALLSEVAASGAYSQHLADPPDTEMVSTDALPMLAVTLRQLWERSDRSVGLTLEDYQRLGGFKGVIARTADAVMNAHRHNEAAMDELRRAFIEMVSLDRNGYCRKPLPMSGLSARTRVVLGHFQAEGLLVSSGAHGCIELAHEALIRTWPTLANWVKEAAADIRRLERFESALKLWVEHPDELLHGIQLEEAVKLTAQGYGPLQTKEAVMLVQRSLHRRNELATRERERQDALRRSESLRLVTESRQIAKREPTAAMRVAWEALLWDANEVSETEFREALARLPAPVRVLSQGDSTHIVSADFAPDRSFVFIVSEASVQTLCLDGSAIARFSLPGNGPWAITAAPDHAGLIGVRSGKLLLLSVGGQVRQEIPLPDWPSEDVGARDCFITVKSKGCGLCQYSSHAWRFEVIVEPEELRLACAVRWLAERAGPCENMHSPFGGIWGIALDDSSRRMLSNSRDGTARCWSPAGESLFVLRSKDRSSGFMDAVFLEGGRVATGTLTGTGEIWTDEGLLLKTFKEKGKHDLFVKGVDPSGRNFITASNAPSHELEVWNSDGERQAILSRDTAHYWCATFSPDGELVAAGCADGAVRVWRWRTQELMLELRGHSSTVHRLKFSPGTAANLLSASHDGSVRIWTLNAPLLPPLAGRVTEQSCVHYALQGTMTGCSDDKTVIWSDQIDQPFLTGSPLDAISDTANGTAVLTEDRSGNVRLWSDVFSTQRVCRCVIPKEARTRGEIEDSAISSDGEFFALAYGEAAAHVMELWAATGKLIAQLDTKDLPGTSDHRKLEGLGFHPQNGRLAAAARNGMVWIWSTAGELLHSFRVESGIDPLRSFAIDPRGEFILVGRRNRVEIRGWEAEEVGVLRPQGYKVEHIVVSPDGTRLLTISDNPSGRPSYFAEIWDRNLVRLALLKAPEAIPFGQFRFHSRGHFLAMRTAADIRIFDAEGVLLCTLAASQGVFPCGFAISPDEDRVAALFSDGIARIWSYAARQRLMSIPTGSQGPIGFSPNGLRLLTASPSGSIDQHALRIGDLFSSAASRLDRGFNSEEIERFGIRPPPRLNLADYVGS